MTYSPDKKRVVCICGSGGSGKTTLLEDILFLAKETTRKGSIDKGNTISDFDSEEISRRVSLQLSATNCVWNKNLIYFIDTPGYHNFIADAICGINAADSALIVVDAKEGPKAQTERFFNQIQNEKKSAIFFINGIDKEDIDIYNTINEIKENITNKVFPIYFPIIENHTTIGFFNILHKKSMFFNKKSENNVPKDIEELHIELIEELSTYDDKLMELYLEGAEIEEESLEEALKKATVESKIYPVIAGCALNSIGTNILLDSIIRLLPHPQEMYNHNVALVFKTYNDPQMGKLSILRVYSGKFSTDFTYFNINKQQEERFGALQKLKGKILEKIEVAETGDIFSVAKLKITQTFDTISDKNSDIKLTPPKIPLPFLSYAVYGTSKENEEKIGVAITKLMESDPTLTFARNDETKEFILTGMGKTHLETIASKLKNKFSVDVTLKIPKVAYKETIKGKTQSHGRYKKQTGGHGQFGDCVIEIEPLPRGSGFEFVDMIVGGAIPKQFIPSVEKGIKMTTEKGILAGYPMTDIKIKLIDGGYHPVDSSDFAFQMAGSIAFKEGVEKCKPVLLEPISSLEVYVPEKNVGDVMGDINAKRGKVLGIDSIKERKDFKIIKALIPENEILEYAPTLRSLTAGRGYFSKKFDHYEEIPQQISQKIIEGSNKKG